MSDWADHRAVQIVQQSHLRVADLRAADEVASRDDVLAAMFAAELRIVATRSALWAGLAMVVFGAGTVWLVFFLKR
jgi:hypothetical protein